MAFSGALGLLNLVSCFALDGQDILEAVLTLLLLTRRGEAGRLTTIGLEQRQRTANKTITFAVCMLLGTGLLVVNLLVALGSLFFSVN